jgi:hypothetical protein
MRRLWLRLYVFDGVCLGRAGVYFLDMGNFLAALLERSGLYTGVPVFPGKA